MKDFKHFVKEDEDVAKTIAKLPPKIQELVKGYKVLFEPGNTLKNDKGHVGMIVNEPKKVIRIASPYNYGREFTLIHEIAHLVYESYIRGTEWEKEWSKVCRLHKGRKKDESEEELWCHAFSARYVKQPPLVHYHPAWIKFIDNFTNSLP